MAQAVKAARLGHWVPVRAAREAQNVGIDGLVPYE